MQRFPRAYAIVGIFAARKASRVPACGCGRLSRLCRGVPTKWVVGDASPLDRLKRDLLAAGVSPEDIDVRDSSVHVVKSAISTAALKASPHWESVTSFVSQNGRVWYEVHLDSKEARRDVFLVVRMTVAERETLHSDARAKGYETAAAYIRSLIKRSSIKS